MPSENSMLKEEFLLSATGRGIDYMTGEGKYSDRGKYPYPNFTIKDFKNAQGRWLRSSRTPEATSVRVSCRDKEQITLKTASLSNAFRPGVQRLFSPEPGNPRRALLLFHAIEPRGIRPIWDCQCVRGRTPRNPGTRGEQKALVEIRCIFDRVNGVRGAGPAQHKVAALRLGGEQPRRELHIDDFNPAPSSVEMMQEHQLGVIRRGGPVRGGIIWVRLDRDTPAVLKRRMRRKTYAIDGIQDGCGRIERDPLRGFDKISISPATRPILKTRVAAR